MKDYIIAVPFIYLLIINFAAMAITSADKRLAKKSGAARIPEKTLFTVALLGGAPAMYLTMRRIRHKTLHKRFMIGLPLIMLLHILLTAVIYLIASGRISLSHV